MNRRAFILSSAAAALTASTSQAAGIELPAEHVAAMQRRKRRIVVLYDAHDTLNAYAKLHAGGDAPFAPFRDALFTYEDEPGSQIDAIWWDIAGASPGSAYPSKLRSAVDHPLLIQWLKAGTDWVKELVNECRRRKLEVVWNDRISEVDGPVFGSTEKQHLNPLKQAHPNWALPCSFWPQGMWNFAVKDLRDYKLSLLRELLENYDFDGVQIDFSRHIPCLPPGRQWELRGHVTEYMRGVRLLALEAARKHGHPVLVAAKVPQTLEGCHTDGLDIAEWSRLNLVDVLTRGSRSMDVDVEGIRAAVGPNIQLQPCFDDHHATDGYRYQPPAFLRGVFANHWQRGADSVVTFNWSVATPAQAGIVGEEHGSHHQAAYHEIGDPHTLAGKDKVLAVERRGGYPWADGFFNRNDTAPLPLDLGAGPAHLVLHISDAPRPGKNHLALRCIVFSDGEDAMVEASINGTPLPAPSRDPEWKDSQIFSPKPQPASGGKGLYPVNPDQHLLRLDFEVPITAWKQGANAVELKSPAKFKLEKVEGHLVHPAL